MSSPLPVLLPYPMRARDSGVGDGAKVWLFHNIGNKEKKKIARNSTTCKKGRCTEMRRKWQFDIFFVSTHPPNTKCSEISIRLHFSFRIDIYLHEKLYDFLYPYKKYPVTHLYSSLNQYIDALTTPQLRTTSDSPPIQVRHKSDNPSAY